MERKADRAKKEESRMFMLDLRGMSMPKRTYVVCIKKDYIKNAQIFKPEPEAFPTLDGKDIYLSSVYEADWEDWEGDLYLCQVTASSENERQQKMKGLAEGYKVPVEILESIRVDEGCANKAHDEETVFGRKEDARRLVEELGCTGYMQRFYEFLQGHSHPENILEKDIPKLSPGQAWHVIYCMQEYFGIFSDRFERCKECGKIYDSYEEGCTVGEETEPVEWMDICGEKQIREFEEAEYGCYCEECRPD